MDARVPFGGDVVFAAGVVNDSAEPVVLAIDHVVHFRKANGGTAPKVFKLTKRTLGAGGPRGADPAALVPRDHDAPALPG